MPFHSAHLNQESAQISSHSSSGGLYSSRIYRGRFEPKLKTGFDGFCALLGRLPLISAAQAASVASLQHMGSQLSSLMATAGTSRADYTPDGPVAQRIAAVTPYFPFKGVPKFYDIGGFLKDPTAFALVSEVLVERYKDQNVTSICGLDARGFVLGPPLALALKKPFFMLRKKGKMPNSVVGEAYSKEYAGNDALSIPRGAVSEGDNVLVIDDLVATGGTLLAAVELIKKFGGKIVECACVVELKFLDARGAMAKKGHGDVPVWAMMSEAILTLGGLKDASIPSEGYVDDGEAH